MPATLETRSAALAKQVSPGRRLRRGEPRAGPVLGTRHEAGRAGRAPGCSQRGLPRSGRPTGPQLAPCHALHPGRSPTATSPALSTAPIRVAGAASRRDASARLTGERERGGGKGRGAGSAGARACRRRQRRRRGSGLCFPWICRGRRAVLSTLMSFDLKMTRNERGGKKVHQS